MKSRVKPFSERPSEGKIPPLHDWRTTDEDEVNRRRLRAVEEQPRITNTDSREKIFSNFRVHSRSGLAYQVEIRDIAGREFSCTCVDFRINGLGTCKHIEAVLLHLDARFKRLLSSAAKQGSLRIDIVPERVSNTLRVARGRDRLPRKLAALFNPEGMLIAGNPAEAVAVLRATQAPGLRISQEVLPWLESRRRAGQMLNGNLAACEERFPVDAAHSVLLVVVERDADLWREKLRPVHEQLFGPGKSDPLAPVRFEVIDRGAAESLKRLTEAGLITACVRATRHLHPPAGESERVLTAEERQRAAGFREKAARKLKMARVLLESDFTEEAAVALREALLFTARALSVEARMPEPLEPADALAPPLAVCWGEALEPLREFASGGAISGGLAALARKLEGMRSPIVSTSD